MISQDAKYVSINMIHLKWLKAIKFNAKELFFSLKFRYLGIFYKLIFFKIWIKRNLISIKTRIFVQSILYRNWYVYPNIHSSDTCRNTKNFL